MGATMDFSCDNENWLDIVHAKQHTNKKQNLFRIIIIDFTLRANGPQLSCGADNFQYTQNEVSSC